MCSVYPELPAFCGSNAGEQVVHREVYIYFVYFVGNIAIAVKYKCNVCVICTSVLGRLAGDDIYMLRIGGDAQRTYASAVRQRNCLASVKTHRTVVVLVVNRAEKRVFISVAADINVVAAHSNIGDLTVRSKGENARPVKVFICFSATRCDAAVCLQSRSGGRRRLCRVCTAGAQPQQHGGEQNVNCPFHILASFVLM